MGLAFITHPECELHDMGEYHPERPARLRAISDRLIASGLDMFVSHYEAPEATRAQLERVHAPGYLDELSRVAPKTGMHEIDADTSMNPHTLPAALRAAGAAVLATDLVLGGKASVAFCSVRPPGHHAERAGAMGFCFFNNVAVGAAHALAQHGLSRVAIADFDVHHGNGTEDIFSGDPRVLMVSTFQHPFYPHSGVEGRSEQMVNVPLAGHSTPADFRAAVTSHWLPALARFQPQLLFISAGFDAHRDDEMSSLHLGDSDYAWVTEELHKVAETHCGGKVISLLEGGYDLHSLGRCAVAHMKSLAGL